METGKPANQLACYKAVMTLKERIEELMAELGWSERQVATIAGVTPSAVAQWLGKGSKPINEIGNLEAALNLAAESGYAPLWIAKGKLPKRSTSWQSPRPDTLERALELLATYLEQLPPEDRQAAGGQLQTLVNIPRMWPSVARTLSEIVAGESRGRSAASG